MAPLVIYLELRVVVVIAAVVVFTSNGGGGGGEYMYESIYRGVGSGM